MNEASHRIAAAHGAPPSPASLSVQLSLPAWIAEYLATQPTAFPTPESRMLLAVELARRNVEQGTGGPFGAAVLSAESGELISVGVNLVVPASCSVAHAEMVAIMLAQQRLDTHDLGGRDLPACELITSTEPCAMCMGAIPWSGLRHVVCGAREEDALAIGMDEGAKPSNWVGAFRERGIAVTRDVCRDEAAAVLRLYAEKGGPIYNGRRHSTS
jgi:tRNA(Arg) A34 adenosine deaminase TadA